MDGWIFLILVSSFRALHALWAKVRLWCMDGMLSFVATLLFIINILL